MTTNRTNPEPSPNGGNGRDVGGRFARGNAGGPGNPYAARVATLRAALMDAVTPEAVQRIAAALVREAEAGNVSAAREVLQRCLGEPAALDLIARLEQLEATNKGDAR